MPKEGGFELRLSDGGTVEAELVVSAVPAHGLAGMVEDSTPAMAAILREIPYAPMNVVCFGYAREKIARDLDGFGYLIPRKEGKSILGTLWDSSIFPNRAPEGQVLLRSMMGGATNPGAIDLAESEVKQRVMADLRRSWASPPSPISSASSATSGPFPSTPPATAGACRPGRAPDALPRSVPHRQRLFRHRPERLRPCVEPDGRTGLRIHQEERLNSAPNRPQPPKRLPRASGKNF